MLLSVDIIAAFALSSVVLSLSPGPSNLYIMACTLGTGTKGGVCAALGMASGSIIYSMGTAFGLASLVKYYPALFLLIKLAGAGYLLYLGIQTWRYAASPHLRKPLSQKPKTIMRTSLLVELTNPKTALFFIAFIPQFIQPDSQFVTAQFIVLGLLYSAIAFASDLTVVGLSQQLGKWLNQHPKAAIGQEKAAGGILICLGSYILFSELIG